MAATAPARLLVIGAGLIGTSIALAARRRWPATRIDAVDPAGADDDVRRQAFDRVLGVDAPIPAHDLAVLACPVDAMPAWMHRLAAVPGHAVVTDVGSVKRAPREAARAAGLSRFVGGHPMAGAAVAGPSLATASLFDGKPWFVDAAAAPDDAVAAVHGLVAACGATLVATSAEAHDRTVAAVSNLPQVVSALLMLVVHDAAGRDGLAHAGGGLRDTTRLAASASSMWRPILAANRDALAPLLGDLARRLDALAARLDDGDAVTATLDAANRARRDLDRA